MPSIYSSGSTDQVLTAGQIVTDRYLDLDGRINATYERVLGFLDDLDAIVTDIVDIPFINVAFPNIETPAAFQSPIAPTIPDLSITFPDLPADFAPGTVNVPAFPTEPTFSVTEPTVTIPPQPGPLLVSAPDDDDKPDLDLDSIVYPDDPDYVLPTIPTLTDITLPIAPVTSIPSFTATAPDDGDLNVPTASFSYSEDDYSSTLLTDVTAVLIDRVNNGGTGLPPSVEEAIWNRARDREDQNALRTRQEAVDDYAKRGFSIPSGVLYDKLQKASQDAQDKISSLSRDIAIKQAELEQSNIQHAIEQSISLERTLIDLFNSKAERTFRVAQLTQEFAISIFEVAVSKVNAQVQIYNATATVYEAQIRAELSKVEIYRSEIEAQRVLGEINVQNISLYTAQLQGIQTQADIFTTQMKGAQTRLEAEKTKLDVYRSDIEAYIAQVEAKKSEYDIFTAQVNAELSKVEVYSAQVSAYAERIQAYGTTVQARGNVTDAEVKAEELRIDAYRLKLESVLSRSDAEAKRIDTLVAGYNAQVQGYTSQLEAERVRYSTDADLTRLDIDIVKSEVEQAVLQNKFQFEKLLAELQLHLSIVETEGQVSSQLLASALSAVNLSASVSGSSSFDVSHEHKYQEK